MLFSRKKAINVDDRPGLVVVNKPSSVNKVVKPSLFLTLN